VDANFDACLAFTLKEEGGFVNDPDDPGGATNMGITLATLRASRSNPALGVLAIKALTQTETSTIYRQSYWGPCSKLPAGVDLMVFDMAVNAGPARAAKQLQAVLGVDEDGVIGNDTLSALQRWRSSDLVTDLANAQAAYYRGLSTFWKFGKGWLARVNRRHDTAFSMAIA
jgi:lysozyme family protein